MFFNQTNYIGLLAVIRKINFELETYVYYVGIIMLF